jgi:hypothetical protein
VTGAWLLIVMLHSPTGYGGYGGPIIVPLESREVCQKVGQGMAEQTHYVTDRKPFDPVIRARAGVHTFWCVNRETGEVVGDQ